MCYFPLSLCWKNLAGSTKCRNQQLGKGKLGEFPPPRLAFMGTRCWKLPCNERLHPSSSRQSSHRSTKYHLVGSPGTVYHCTFVPHLHYQLSKTCSRHNLFSRSYFTDCFHSTSSEHCRAPLYSDSRHVTAS